MPSDDEEKKIKNLQAVIADVWKRARVNGFAHRAAADRIARYGLVLFTLQILSALISVIFVILVNMAATEDAKNSYTLISAGSAILSIFFCVMESHCKFGLKSQEHNFLLGSFQHIAQRAREAKWPDKPYEDTLELLRDMERDFQLLKARGIEPRDMDFKVAHSIMEEVSSNPNFKDAQSFPDSVDADSKD